MEKLDVHHKCPKVITTKVRKKKPIKVVYISNPMKVKASAAEFRAVVQELTGQDSDVSEMENSPWIDHDVPNLETSSGGVADAAAATEMSSGPCEDGSQDHCAGGQQYGRSAYDGVVGPFRMFDEAAFASQQLGNLQDVLPSPVYYDGNAAAGGFWRDSMPSEYR